MRWMLAAAGIAVTCGTLEAQQIPNLAQGQQVRLTAPGMTQAPATLLAATPDTIVVARISTRHEAGAWRIDTTRYAVPRRDISGFEVLGSRSHAVEGTLLGLGGGALIGLLVCPLGEALANTAGWDRECPVDVAKATVIGGVVGSGVGALAGLLWRTPEWQVVPLDRLAEVRIGLIRRRGRSPGFGVAVAF